MGKYKVHWSQDNYRPVCMPHSDRYRHDLMLIADKIEETNCKKCLKVIKNDISQKKSFEF